MQSPPSNSMPRMKEETGLLAFSCKKGEQQEPRIESLAGRHKTSVRRCRGGTSRQVPCIEWPSAFSACFSHPADRHPLTLALITLISATPAAANTHANHCEKYCEGCKQPSRVLGIESNIDPDFLSPPPPPPPPSSCTSLSSSSLAPLCIPLLSLSSIPSYLPGCSCEYSSAPRDPRARVCWEDASFPPCCAWRCACCKEGNGPLPIRYLPSIHPRSSLLTRHLPF